MSIAKKKRKSKPSKRSLAAKKGWATRRKNALLKRELGRLQKELEAEGKRLKKAKRDMKREKKRVAALHKEASKIGEHIVMLKAEAMNVKEEAQVPVVMGTKRKMTKESIAEYMDRAWRLYGRSPGLYDSALELADYWDVDVNEVFDLWETPP